MIPSRDKIVWRRRILHACHVWDVSVPCFSTNFFWLSLPDLLFFISLDEAYRIWHRSRYEDPFDRI